MVNLFDSKMTIYNDIPANAIEDRRFNRFVLDKCNVQGGRVSRADGTIENVVNAISVITKNIDEYLSPSEYLNTPSDIKAKRYTVQVGDFIVFGEVDDVVENSLQWAQLQKKYEHGGIKIVSIAVNIHGLSVDNITMSNV